MNPMRPILRHIIIKMAKIQDRENLKGGKGEKGSNIQRNSNKASSWLLNRNIQTRRKWQEIFQVMKSKDLQPRILYPAKLLIKMEGKISFPDKRKLKEYPSTEPALQDMLKG